MTSHRNGTVLCDTCRKIDFAYLMTCPDDQLGLPLVHSEDCELCAILTPNQRPGEQAHLTSYWFFHEAAMKASLGPPGMYACRETDWVSRDAARTFPSIALKVLVKPREPRSGFTDNIQEEPIVFCRPPKYSEDSNTLWRPSPLQEAAKYMAARAWLNECRNNHGAACNIDHGAACNAPSNRVQGMRLIDVHDSKVVDVKDLTNPRWIALSYVWGNEAQSTPIDMSCTERLPNRLPHTINDAIAVTKGLGYRYLWVDELCVDQLNTSHRTSQIKKMDQIYQGADLTIVAASGDHKNYGLPGVNKTSRRTHPVIHLDHATVFSIGPDPRASLRLSTWWTRAWTFQEGYLSRRLLVFSEHQMTFYCRKAAWMEALGMPPDLDPRELNVDLSHLWISLWDLRLDPSSSSRSFKPLIHFEILVGKYIDRHMSYSRDALNAAAGVLHHLGKGDDQVFNFSGLPYYRGPKGAESPISLERVIGHALGWYIRGGPCIRRAMFSSWTWAGWSETRDVGWMWLTPKEEQCHLRNAKLENECGEAIILPEQNDAASGSILQRQLDTVRAIVFEAPCVPIAGFTVADHHLHISGESVYLYGDVTDDQAESMNTEQHLWSCFLLRTHDWAGSTILLCRWVDGQTAERFFCFNTLMEPHRFEDISFFETSGEIRRVRLI